MSLASLRVDGWGWEVFISLNSFNVKPNLMTAGRFAAAHTTFVAYEPKEAIFCTGKVPLSAPVLVLSSVF